MGKGKIIKLSPDIEIGFLGVAPCKQISHRKIISEIQQKKDTKAVKEFKSVFGSYIQKSLENKQKSKNIIPMNNRIFVFCIQVLESQHEYDSKDLDNMVKIIIDTLEQENIFKNDAQVCEIYATKLMASKSLRINGDFLYVGIKEISANRVGMLFKHVNFERAIEMYNTPSTIIP